MPRTLPHVRKLRGRVKLPGDKSISHRALMLGAIAQGRTEIENLSDGLDVAATANCLQELGIQISRDVEKTFVTGKGLQGLRQPKRELNVGNSGTTIRLLSGILAGQPFPVTISGDESILSRPMGRIIEPLTEMGASVEAMEGEHAPLQVKGGNLTSIQYQLAVASAQVKSCVLLAGLYANGQTSVTEFQKTRDHTERMLQTFGAEVEENGLMVAVRGRPKLFAQELYIPGDLSAAAFFIGAALLLPGSEVTIENVGINPTRSSLLTLLTEMGANIEILNVTALHNELVADLFVTHSNLSAHEISGTEVVKLIDEIPLLAVLATQAEGVTEITGARELRLKESDRLRAITANLKGMGAQIEEQADGLRIEGPTPLHQAELNSFGDHRIAMACSVASLLAEKPSTMKNSACADVSFPGFFAKLKGLGVD